MRTIILLLALLPSALVGQRPAPRFLYFYRESIKRGADSAYRAIENDGAQICADLRCPNPYLGLENLSGTHEAWWLNTFDTEADTARVAGVYATNRALANALGGIAQRKATLVGAPVQGFAVYRADISRGPAWSPARARFVVITVTRQPRSADGSVWMTADSNYYILRTAQSRREAESLARGLEARVFAIRPNWSMPAPAWASDDPGFWQEAPVAKKRE